MSEISQIFEIVNFGLVILDNELRVTCWNHWMAWHSGIDADRIDGAFLLDFFPELNTPRFLRNCKMTLAFGNFSFFSQKLHHFLFPFKPDGSFKSSFEYMQQNCTLGPLRNDSNAITGIFLIVQDVTELASYEQKLIELNMKDGLTGVYNRRFFQTRLADEIERHGRYAEKLSLVMFDIDFFKKVNDGYGHQCGDLVLKSVAAQVGTAIRKTDCLVRYGGEEFCCLLPHTDVTTAHDIADRFRRKIEVMETPCQEHHIKVTISLGVSELRNGDSGDMLLKRADEALYMAKASGRNCTIVIR